jgi:hypothetical protein
MAVSTWGSACVIRSKAKASSCFKSFFSNTNNQAAQLAAQERVLTVCVPDWLWVASQIV